MGPFGNRSSSAGQGSRRGLKLWPILLFGAYFAYYWFSHSNEASFTGRKQLLDTSAQEEAALGLQSYREILSQSNVVTQGPLPQQVREIAQRLVEVAPKVEKYLADSAGMPATTDWKAYEWQVSVIQSDQVNAFCLPGGKIAVYTGIVPVAQNADGLAAIMGHEIAHALLRHGGERMAQQKLVQIGSIAASMSTGEMDPQQRQMVMAAIGAGAVRRPAAVRAATKPSRPRRPVAPPPPASTAEAPKLGSAWPPLAGRSRRSSCHPSGRRHPHHPAPAMMRSPAGPPAVLRHTRHALTAFRVVSRTPIRMMRGPPLHGEVAEWSNVPDSKSCACKRTVGSTHPLRQTQESPRGAFFGCEGWCGRTCSVGFGQGSGQAPLPRSIASCRLL